MSESATTTVYADSQVDLKLLVTLSSPLNHSRNTLFFDFSNSQYFPSLNFTKILGSDTFTTNEVTESTLNVSFASSHGTGYQFVIYIYGFLTAPSIMSVDAFKIQDY